MNEMTSDIIKFCQMLLPRWGEFMLWVLMPRAVPSADGVCPFRGQVGALLEDCEYAWIGLLEH
jgi:hypothetical protein